MKALIITNVIALGLLFAVNGAGDWASPPVTTSTHRGTAKLFG